MAKTNNPNGRPKGTPNKVTAELRTILKDFIYSELERLPEYFETIETAQRLELLVKLIPYALPKVEAVKDNRGEAGENDLWG